MTENIEDDGISWVFDFRALSNVTLDVFDLVVPGICTSREVGGHPFYYFYFSFLIEITGI